MTTTEEPCEACIIDRIRTNADGSFTLLFDAHHAQLAASRALNAELLAANKKKGQAWAQAFYWLSKAQRFIEQSPRHQGTEEILEELNRVIEEQALIARAEKEGRADAA
jgi:hypothetical protein